MNKASGEFVANDDVLSATGHKWTLETLFQHLHDVMHINTDDVWTRICDCVVKVGVFLYLYAFLYFIPLLLLLAKIY